MADIDYRAILDDLISKRDKLNAAIAGIETMLDMRELSGQTQSGNSAPAKNDLGPGAFLGMTVVDATILLLKTRRQQQRTEEIVRALQDGGIAFSSANPVNTVGSILNRNWTQGGEVVRTARGVWGLAEWHPRLRKKGKNGTSASSSDVAEGAQETEEEAEEETSFENTTSPQTSV